MASFLNGFLAVIDIEAPQGGRGGEKQEGGGVTKAKFGSWWRRSSDNKSIREAMERKPKIYLINELIFFSERSWIALLVQALYEKKDEEAEALFILKI